MKNQGVLAIIKARMASKRLPGKSLKKLAGKPLLEHVVDRLSMVEDIDEIVVATSVEKGDDPIATFCEKKGVNFFRGSETDVLSRFARAAEECNPKYIVRVCGDEPLVDPNLVEQAIREHIQEKVDYTTNIGSFLTGVDVEVFNYDVLRELDEKVEGKKYRETETRYIRENPNLYDIHRMKPPEKLNRPDIVVTVDTEEDFDFVESIIKNSRNGDPDTEEIVRLVDSGEVSRKPKILVRADGSKEKGMGDLISSMNIIGQMRDEYQFVFASKDYEQGIDFVKSQGYDVLTLPLENNDPDDLKLIKEYCNMHKIKFCIAQLVPNKPQFVKKLSEFVKILMIDFGGGIEVASDMLLCWDIDVDKDDYEFSRSDTVCLLGPEYVPLKEDILDHKKKDYGSEVEEVVVTVGGSDPHNITFELLEALEEISETYKFRFILGPGFKHFKEFEDKANEKFDYIKNPENPHKIFGESDVTISTGGLTSFELAALGVPFIGVSKIPHEIERLRKMSDLGVCRYVSMDGNLKKQIRKALADLEDKKKREEMGEKGRGLVDGKGAKRVAEELRRFLGDLYED